jgi:hypothetical protein
VEIAAASLEYRMTDAGECEGASPPSSGGLQLYLGSLYLALRPGECEGAAPPQKIESRIAADTHTRTICYQMSHNVPVLLITAHGKWCDDDKAFQLPINITWGLASKVGTINLLDPKVVNSVSRIVRDARNARVARNNFTRTVFKTIQQLDHSGTTVDRSRRPKEPTQSVEWAKDLIATCDSDGTAYLRQVNNGAYEVLRFGVGTTIPNKSYYVSKNESENAPRQERNNNRAQLLMPHKAPIDILPNWSGNYMPETIPERVRLRTATSFTMTLRELLAKVAALGVKDLVIVDLACNSVDTDGTARSDRLFARNVLRELRDC